MKTGKGFTLTDSTGDSGAWGYCNDRFSSDRLWGDVWIDCTHTDSKGAAWGLYRTCPKAFIETRVVNRYNQPRAAQNQLFPEPP